MKKLWSRIKAWLGPVPAKPEIYVGHPPRPPEPGEFFDPEPCSWLSDNPGPQSIGPARIEIGRLGPRQFRLLRHVGYCDAETGDVFVMPRRIDTWTGNFSSAPTLVNRIVPVLGTHFTPIVLHDGLVEDAKHASLAQGDGYFGPKVTREEADRIVRDAMKQQGTGFLRRWIAWVGMLIGTIHSEEGVGDTPSKRKRIRRLLWVTLLGLITFGIYSTLQILGVHDNLWWMSGRDWQGRLFYGGLMAIVIPAIWSLVLWRGRRVFALILSVGMAVLLPAFVVTFVLSVLYLLLERLFAWNRARGSRFTKPNEATFTPLALGQREPC